MATDEHNIEALLDFSKQQDELIEGHQKEMQQVLAGKEQLRIALAREHTLTKEQAVSKNDFEDDRNKIAVL